MLFTSFAHRLLLAFGLVVFAVLAFFAAKVGFLGEAAQDLTIEVLFKLRAFYWHHEGDLNFAAKVIGVTGTCLGAAWTVHKGWHYAERNLPTRLNELSTHWKEAIVRSRPDVIPVLREIATVGPAMSSPTLLQSLARWFYDGDRSALARCEAALKAHRDQLSALSNARSKCRAELVTTHLELGSRLGKESGREQEALEAFEKALKFNRTDLDALELAARQSFALNVLPRARSYLTVMADAAANSGNSLRHARALRFHAEILEAGQRQERELAREMLAGAISVLRGPDIHDPAERDFELGLAYLQLANVQIIRERFTAARTALMSAEKLLERGASQQALGRLKVVQERLAKAELERDNPDVKD